MQRPTGIPMTARLRLTTAGLLTATLIVCGPVASMAQSSFSMVEVLRTLERAYPKFLTLQSIGKSYEGRDMWLMVINNPDTGPAEAKTGFWVDGNIHGNEIQGVEVNLYLIWFLMENYDTLPDVKELVDQRSFYVLPTQNARQRQRRSLR